jgi:ribulose-phosphate 3-epimerase
MKASIAPSILSADFLRLGDEIKAAEDAGAGYIHIDVMDGLFVPNITIGPLVVEAAKKATNLPLDVHLMIEKPERFVKEFVSAGADYLVVHAEASVHLHRTLQSIKEEGIMAGVSLNPSTSLEVIRHVLPYMDLLLIMSVNPGFGGQSFIPEALGKVREARAMIEAQGLKTLIEVDGGVKPSNAKEVVAAGADILVMGSAFYGSDDYAAVVRETMLNIGDNIKEIKS